MDNNKQLQVTSKALEALKIELSDLVDQKRPKIVERLERARNEGDLAENSDYSNARDELEFIDGRIDELKHVIDNAKIIKSNGNSSAKIQVGTKVKVKTNGSEHIFEIVGDWEADPMQKKISHTSPLGQALVDKAVGDEVEVEAPAGKINYKIVSIE
jgi:transcription elongation factor GreA